MMPNTIPTDFSQNIIKHALPQPEYLFLSKKNLIFVCDIKSNNI